MICPSLSGVDLDGNLVKVECLKHECPKYKNIQGQNPQTGEVVDRWDCVDAWMPVLLIENSKQQARTASAVESFRNEMVTANQQTNNLLLSGAGSLVVS